MQIRRQNISSNLETSFCPEVSTQYIYKAHNRIVWFECWKQASKLIKKLINCRTAASNSIPPHLQVLD